MRLLILALCLVLSPSPWAAPPAPQIEVAFSPDEGSEALVIRAIDHAQSSLRMAAYLLTSPPIVRALVAAKQRGVDVRVLIDEEGNRNAASTAAMNLLINADIPLRTIGIYAIHHDKYIVVDGRHTETGSFNYTRAAAKSNSENVIVIWDDPAVAAKYTAHWNSRWPQGTDVRSRY